MTMGLALSGGGALGILPTGEGRGGRAGSKPLRCRDQPKQLLSLDNHRVGSSGIRSVCGAVDRNRSAMGYCKSRGPDMPVYVIPDDGKLVRGRGKSAQRAGGRSWGTHKPPLAVSTLRTTSSIWREGGGRKGGRKRGGGGRKGGRERERERTLDTTGQKGRFAWS